MVYMEKGLVLKFKTYYSLGKLNWFFVGFLLELKVGCVLNWRLLEC